MTKVVCLCEVFCQAALKWGESGKDATYKRNPDLLKSKEGGTRRTRRGGGF